MHRHFSMSILLLAASPIATMPAMAALEVRDLNNDTVIDAYYDTNLNITWLKDANLAASNTFGLPYETDLGHYPNDVTGSSYSEIIFNNGTMTYGAALHWIDAMNTTSYLGYNDWRLPTVLPINGINYNYVHSVIGTTDVGYNISAPNTLYANGTGSEMAFMYYQNLGDLGYYNSIGGLRDCFVANINVCFVNVGPFDNLQPGWYWAKADNAPYASASWFFQMAYGLQNEVEKNAGLYVWAVRTGDVAAVPEPSNYTLLILGVGLVGWLARRRGKLFTSVI